MPTLTHSVHYPHVAPPTARHLSRKPVRWPRQGWPRCWSPVQGSTGVGDWTRDQNHIVFMTTANRGRAANRGGYRVGKQVGVVGAADREEGGPAKREEEVQRLEQFLVEYLGADRLQATFKKLEKWFWRPKGCRVSTLEESIPMLESLLGVQRAKAAVYKSPSVLAYSPATLKNSFDFLVKKLGEEEALVLVGRNPMVLGARNHTEALEALEDTLLGDKQLAMEFVKRCPLLLSATTIREAMQALIEVLGDKQLAMKYVNRDPYLLKAKATTIREALGALIDVLGSKGLALEKVQKHPNLLKAKNICGAFETLTRYYGSKQAQRMVSDKTYLLCTSPNTIRKAADKWDAELGTKAAKDTVPLHPNLLTYSVSCIDTRLGVIEEYAGVGGASAAILCNPTLITYSPDRLRERIDKHGFKSS